MKAKLVYVSLVTRVVVPDNATESQILKLAEARFIDKIQQELNEHVEEIVDDVECPYTPDMDGIYEEAKSRYGKTLEKLGDKNVGFDICSKCGAVQEYGTMKDVSEVSFDLRCEKCRPLIERECVVEIEYTDIKGVTRTAVIMHNGDSDCWDGEEFEDEDIAFDFNTFGGTEYGDSPDDFRLNAYQCMVKRDGYWTMDDNVEIPCKILNITPIK